MTTLLPQFGVLMMLSYALLNLYNIMLLRINLPLLTLLLLFAGFAYFVYRIQLLTRDKQGASQSEVMGLVLVLLSATAIALQFLNLQEYAADDGIFALSNIRSEWKVSMLWFFAGGSTALFSLKDSPKLALLVLLATGLAFLNGLDDQFLVNYHDVTESGVVEKTSHLQLERPILFLLILAYALSTKTKWLVALVGCFLLFSMGGRTSLLVFGVCIIVMNVGRKTLINLFYLAIIGLVVFFSLRFAIENQIIDIENKRIEKMLFIGGVEEDGSYEARKQLLTTNLQFLDKQFLYGDPTIISKEIGSASSYIHNLLSAWQFYGFFVFFWIILMLLDSLRRMILLKNRNPEPKIIFGSFFLIYVTISITIAKAANWDLLWFVLGFWALLPTIVKKEKKRRKRRIKTSVS